MKNAGEIKNSADPDQTAHLGASCLCDSFLIVQSYRRTDKVGI